MTRRLAQAVTVLATVLATVFLTAPGAHAMWWVELTGVTPTAMSANPTASGVCVENWYVKACMKPNADPEVFFAKDLNSDGASVGIYVEVQDTGRRFACYHSFGVNDIGRCATNIGEGHVVCFYTLKWDRSFGSPPVYDTSSRTCLWA